MDEVKKNLRALLPIKLIDYTIFLECKSVFFASPIKVRNDKKFFPPYQVQHRKHKVFFFFCDKLKVFKYLYKCDVLSCKRYQLANIFVMSITVRCEKISFFCYNQRKKKNIFNECRNVFLASSRNI